MKRHLAVLLVLSCCAFAQTTPSCEAVAKLSLPNVKIVSAAPVTPGGFPLPEGMPPRAAAAFKALPAFCRVQALATPSADSSIAIEIWMPSSGWNGRFRGLGNGGFAGSIGYPQMAISLAQGYAVAATDDGHKAVGTDASWALGHPEKVADFGHRAVHEMTRVGQAVVHAYYGKAQEHSYFIGCSDGGREALMEAQRYPDDYDGILAGAPANNWTHLLTSAIWDAQATTVPPEAYIPTAKLPAIATAVNQACDAKDGVTDGILNDPRACRFDPAVLQCRAEDSNRCLTAPQVAALTKLYGGAKDSHDRQIFPGFTRGAEASGGGWSVWITGEGPGKAVLFAFGNGFFADMVYQKKDWDYRSVTMDEAVKAADAKTAAILNSTDPNLSRFRQHGGKLVIYHGWNDPAISALNTIDYFESVVRRMGAASVDSFARLYMVPGMLHCGGGPGATDFGVIAAAKPNDPEHSLSRALEQWVESGKAPATIVARKPAGGAQQSSSMTRPLCPYPQAAKYKGSGDSNDAANFACAK